MTRRLRRVESVAEIDKESDVDNEQESSESSEEASEDEEEIDTSLQTPSRRKGKGKAVTDDDHGQDIIVQSNFDAYFTYAASRAQTSTNVYSQLVLPLTSEEYAIGIRAASRRVKPPQTSIFNPERKNEIHSRLSFELQEGFNIICYGVGSKRSFLNEFASMVCSKRGHVVIANAFQPIFTIKDLLSRIEQIPELEELGGLSGTVDKQATRIHDHFARKSQNLHLYLIIHNIDATSLRTARSKAILGLLAMNPRIHIIGSTDHLNASLLWSSSEVFTRKPVESSSPTTIRGFSWLFHDLTTLAPYDVELSFADRSSLSGAYAAGRRKTGLSAGQNLTAMSETAASHILASVTQKAKKLFSLLGNKQLEAIEAAGDAATNDLQQYGMSYDALFNASRDDFIAVNDTALRSLLGEFRDHSLVLSAPDAGEEVLWIPLRKERLIAVLDSLHTA